MLDRVMCARADLNFRRLLYPGSLLYTISGMCDCVDMNVGGLLYPNNLRSGGEKANKTLQKQAARAPNM